MKDKTDAPRKLSEAPPLTYKGKPVTAEELIRLMPFSCWLFAEHPAFKDVSPGRIWMLPG